MPRHRTFTFNGDCYILQGRLVRRVEMDEWWMCYGYGNPTVGRSVVGAMKVKTIFTGLDANFSGAGDPQVFETTISGAARRLRPIHHSWTWEQAEKTHRKVVKRLKERYRRADHREGGSGS